MKMIYYAHGQMKEHELERIMFDFINGEIDVLVSTTIIETGLDISNVNTMIIHDSDNLGLSQLYQLRGRVGRSNRNAYAFLMYKRDKMLKEVAEKRLAAIKEFAGNGGSVEGRLSAVDPVRQREVASFGGLGVSPSFMVSDGGDRLLIASAAEGLMIFNTRTRALDRGAGSGIPLLQPRGLTSDGLGRSYVVEAGSCTVGGSAGRIRVFGADLVERRTIATGVCPVAAAITEIQADLFPLQN